MLSRIADSLFWLTRYMERADGLLRLTGTHYILSLDKDENGSRNWRSVLEVLTVTPEEKLVALQNDTKAALQKLLLDGRNADSLKSIVNKARENARGGQDHITKEVWEGVNYMYHLVNGPALAERLHRDDTLQVIGEFTRQSVFFTGVMEITMPRGMGWNFMNLGKYTERCLQTIGITEKQLSLMDFSNNKTIDMLEWRYLLLSLSGYELHLKTYQNAHYNNNVFHQVLLNENFPRSVLYSLNRIERYLERIMEKNQNVENEGLMRTFARLHSKVRYVDPDTLNNVTLQALLQEVRGDLMDFNKQLGYHFFSYA